MSRRWAGIVMCAVVLAAPGTLAAQEGRLAAEFRREGEAFRENCGGEFDPGRILSCGTTVVTGKPLHLAVGSLAPENGFGFGVAFVTAHAPSENWRLSWSADIVRAFGGAWRAGAYMKIVHTPVEPPVVVSGPDAASSAANGIRPYTSIDIYAQTISLPTISFFGVGPDSARDARTLFGMRQTIVGADAVVPIAAPALRRFNLAFVGEMNGRFIDVRSAPGEDAPSIEQRFTNVDAPGLAEQPGFLQLGEGVRIRPSLLADHVRLNYLAQLQQFVAVSDETYSFRRWTLDLDHEIPIYRNSSRLGPRPGNTPNDCAISPSTPECPKVVWGRNRTGTVNVRMFLSKSQVSNGSVVPFYLQRTIGGSDLNGDRILPGYDDYRFRAPDVLVFSESLEHSIWGPIGGWLLFDQGRVGPDPDGGFGDWKHSVGVGLTVRAGGIPAVLVSWARGSGEGSHFAVTMSTSLLGGGARPSLH